MIQQGFILAAGLGQRMRPLSNDKPKPMVEVHGRPMIEYALDQLAAHGTTRCVINTHYKAEVLEDYLQQKCKSMPFDIIISREEVLLDTGGGLKQGLRFLDASQPVIVLSGDSILVDAPHIKTLQQMESAWKPDTSDMLLSLQPLDTMVLTPGVGDYMLKGGKPIRTPDHSGKYMWNSARIINPRIFDGTPDTPFSFLQLMDAAQNKNRLSAVIHEGTWHHLSTPDDVKRVSDAWDVK